MQTIWHIKFLLGLVHILWVMGDDTGIGLISDQGEDETFALTLLLLWIAIFSHLFAFRYWFYGLFPWKIYICYYEKASFSKMPLFDLNTLCLYMGQLQESCTPGCFQNRFFKVLIQPKICWILLVYTSGCMKNKGAPLKFLFTFCQN